MTCSCRAEPERLKSENEALKIRLSEALQQQAYDLLGAGPQQILSLTENRPENMRKEDTRILRALHELDAYMLLCNKINLTIPDFVQKTVDILKEKP